MNEQAPLRQRAAWRAVGLCVLATFRLLRQRRIHLRRERVGSRVCFADGTSSRVYRETVVDRPTPAEPCVLVVAFKLRAVHGRGHLLFRWESLLNTPLFVGFPGFVSKLWLTHDDHGVYRGLYQWDGAAAAQAYAQALWRVLALVSEAGSIAYRVLPGIWRDDLVAPSEQSAQPIAEQAADWWRPVTVITTRP